MRPCWLAGFCILTAGWLDAGRRAPHPVRERSCEKDPVSSMEYMPVSKECLSDPVRDLRSVRPTERRERGRARRRGQEQFTIPTSITSTEYLPTVYGETTRQTIRQLRLVATHKVPRVLTLNKKKSKTERRGEKYSASYSVHVESNVPMSRLQWKIERDPPLTVPCM
jgi:hypothetical protein